MISSFKNIYQFIILSVYKSSQTDLANENFVLIVLVIFQLVYCVKGTAKRIYDKIVASSESIMKFDGMTRKGLNGLWFPFRTKSQKTANGTVTSLN